ncbi:hypothetical protein WN55_09859 [Dufourea novaeangliae]|uniref:Uncharacterized protein n=1 Tax=Dufourea novaeangliae TaxID=178035 RepID=A0A154P7P9_DUFNO|nr:hypothetical protein WN55_09859 [Dufourea novaeangliae]
MSAGTKSLRELYVKSVVRRLDKIDSRDGVYVITIYGGANVGYVARMRKDYQLGNIERRKRGFRGR